MASPEIKPVHLVVTGGGTGGHLFPGIAVAEAIMAERSGSQVLFIGTDRQIDHQVLGQHSFMTASLQSSEMISRRTFSQAGSLSS